VSFVKEYDVFIVPFADVNASTRKNITQSFVKIVGGSLGVVALSGVTQLEVDKGNVITAHRVDGGYALTQRGGKNDDRVFIRILLTGTNRYVLREYLSFLADQKAFPLSFLSRAVRLAKCQIESLKVIENSERRQALIIHVIFRQLRTFQDNILANTLNVALATLAGKDGMVEESLYDSGQSEGGVPIISNAATFVYDAATGVPFVGSHLP